MEPSEDTSMIKPSIRSELFKKLLEIAENSDASVVYKVASEIFGNDLASLKNDGVFKYYGNLSSIEVFDGGEQRRVDIQRCDGKNMYFSTADGWVAIADEDMSLYQLNLGWIISTIMYALDIDNRHVKEIHTNYIWAFGEHRIEKQKINIIVVRNIKKAPVLDILSSYLDSHHPAKSPALVIALDLNVPKHLRLPNHNQLISISDAMRWDRVDFEMNGQLLAQKMGGTIGKHGFSNGFRTLMLNGETYHFSKKQADALQYMYERGGPAHKHEILAHIESSSKKMLEIFRKEGKPHAAWGVVIKNDGKGNYWLDM
jgi:hypothetical protein